MSIELQVLSIELQVLSIKLQASSIELQVLSLELQVLSIELRVAKPDNVLSWTHTIWSLSPAAAAALHLLGAIVASQLLTLRQAQTGDTNCKSLRNRTEQGHAKAT